MTTLRLARDPPTNCDHPQMMCKCDWRVTPQLTDSEFDKFIGEQNSQLVVVSVYSSGFPQATPCDNMIEELYYGINYR